MQFGPDQPEPAAPRGREQRAPAPSRPPSSTSPKPEERIDRRARAQRGETLDRLGHGGRAADSRARGRRRGQIVDSSHRRQAQDGLAGRIHDVDRARRSRAACTFFEQDVAELGRIARHAEHGRAAGARTARRGRSCACVAPIDDAHRLALGRAISPSAQRADLRVRLEARVKLARAAARLRPPRIPDAPRPGSACRSPPRARSSTI